MTSRRRRHCAVKLAVVSAVLLTNGCNDSKPADPASAGDAGTTSSSAPARRMADPDAYISRGSQYPQWGFVTPSSDWVCVIGMYPSGGDHTSCAADLKQGPLPIAGVPFAQSPMGGISTQVPNVISISESSDPAFQAVDAPIWGGADAPRTLPVDTVLQAGEFSCNVQKSTVSCRNDTSGMGFTFSTEGYRLVYTDVPAG